MCPRYINAEDFFKVWYNLPLPLPHHNRHELCNLPEPFLEITELILSLCCLENLVELSQYFENMIFQCFAMNLNVILQLDHKITCKRNGGYGFDEEIMLVTRNLKKNTGQVSQHLRREKLR